METAQTVFAWGKRFWGLFEGQLKQAANNEIKYVFFIGNFTGGLGGHKPPLLKICSQKS